MKSLVVFSDTHINSCVGLCPENVQLDDGGTYHRSRTQLAIANKWKTFEERVQNIKKLNDVIVVCNGDLAETDDKRRSFQIINHNPAVIEDMCVTCLEPIIDAANKIFFVRGTEAHSGKSCHMEELVAGDIDNAVPFNNKINSWWYLPLEVEGVRFDIAHHTQMGNNESTRGYVAQRLAVNTMTKYTKRSERFPDVVIRSHVHRWGDSYDEFPIRAVITPAWCMASSFIHKVSPGDKAEIGAIIFHCDNGKYEIEKVKFYEDKRIWVKV